MTDGTLAVRRRDAKAAEESAAAAKEKALQSGAYEFFTDMEAVFGTGHVKQKGKDAPPVIGPSDEFKVESRRRAKLKEFDRHLKGFKYASALDAGLKPVRLCTCGTAARGAPSDSSTTSPVELTVADHTAVRVVCAHSRAHLSGRAQDRAVGPGRDDARAHLGLLRQAHYRSEVWRVGGPRCGHHHW